VGPDVWKAYKGDIESQCIDLEQRDGWLELLDVLDRHADTAIVINTKAGNQSASGSSVGCWSRRCASRSES
jgi:hypothetical protein